MLQRRSVSARRRLATVPPGPPCTLPQAKPRLAAVAGIPTTVVAYTTDIPAFGAAWGQPLLIGPGTIHVAHTLEERVPKRQLLKAVELYQRIVKDLCKRELK